jgi:hypothetical protein
MTTTMTPTIREPGVPSASATAAAGVVLSPWDSWSPQEYLADYYRFVEPDEIETIRFISQASMRLKVPANILVFGCGPTLHHVFPIAPYASEIHLADYLPGNLDQIRAWIEQRAPYHDWSAFVRYTCSAKAWQSPTMTTSPRGRRW